MYFFKFCVINLPLMCNLINNEEGIAVDVEVLDVGVDGHFESI